MTSRQAQAHLPPRCPIPKKPISSADHDPISSKSIVEDHPAWLDDLLNDPESNPKGRLLRSVSDSVTLLDSFADSLSIVAPNYDEGDSVGNPTCSGLESSGMYGPNSPRRRSSSSFSENAIVSALSEYVPQEPVEYVDGSLCVSGIGHSDVRPDVFRTDGELNADVKAKRHPGQRSRIRKLQYIAELEKTVNVLQNLESDLAVRVASLLQQRAALSMENSTLKQQLARLRKEKLIMDGQYQILKKEAKILKNSLAHSTNRNIQTFFGSNPADEADRLEAVQTTLDMEKLNLF